MKNPILSIIKSFFDRHFLEGKPILLGCSGGPDSIALLHLILELRSFFSFTLHVVHVDHGWRKESGQEARELEAMVSSLGLPFHLHRIEQGWEDKNLEAEGRERRFKAFLQIYQRIGAQALLLAHHADDQSETILKRLFEGGGLLNLGGIRPVAEIYHMQVWRPLLKVPKERLLDWLRQGDFKWFDDRTNEDERFLRTRFRKRIIPFLEQHFKKNIGSTLSHIGTATRELKEYLEKKTAPLSASILRGPFGIGCDLSFSVPVEPFELKFFFKKLFLEEGLALSRTVIEELVQLVDSNSWKKKIPIREGCLFIDRGVLFFLRREFPVFPISAFSTLTKATDCQRVVEKGWIWQIKCREEEAEAQSFDWRTFWVSGKISMQVPKGEYDLVSVSKLLNKSKNFHKEAWRKGKIPILLRTLLPVAQLKGGLEAGENFAFFSSKGQGHIAAPLQIIIELQNENV